MNNVMEYLSIFSIKDFFEIIFFVLVFNKIFLFLFRDYQKPLLKYVILYFSFLNISWYFNYFSINILLFNMLPIVILSFLIFHKDIIYKNLNSTLNLKSETSVELDWIESLIKSVLIFANTNKALTLIIEKKDNISDFINYGVIIDSNFSESLFKLISNSIFFDEQKFLLLFSNGKLKSVNSTFNICEKLSLNKENDFDENFIFLTSKTDSLILKIDSKSRLFSIFIAGKFVKNLSSKDALNILKQYLIYDKSSLKGSINECNLKKSINKEVVN